MDHSLGFGHDQIEVVVVLWLLSDYLRAYSSSNAAVLSALDYTIIYWLFRFFSFEKLWAWWIRLMSKDLERLLTEQVNTACSFWHLPQGFRSAEWFDASLIVPGILGFSSVPWTRDKTVRFLFRNDYFWKSVSYLSRTRLSPRSLSPAHMFFMVEACKVSIQREGNTDQVIIEMMAKKMFHLLRRNWLYLWSKSRHPFTHSFRLMLLHPTIISSIWVRLH